MGPAKEFDERSDEVSEETWRLFAGTWLRQLREGVRDGEHDYRKDVVPMNFCARPELQWKFLKLCIAAAHTDEELGHIAAGPLEHLLGWHGDDFIDAIEAECVANPQFARTTTGLRKYLMSDAVWARMLAIQDRVRAAGNQIAS